MRAAVQVLEHPWLVTLGWLVVLSVLTTSIAALALAGWRLRRHVRSSSARHRAAAVALVAAVALSLTPLPVLMTDALRGPSSVETDAAPPDVAAARSVPSSPAAPPKSAVAPRASASWTPGPRLGLSPLVPGIFGALWIAGALVMGMRLLVAYGATARVARRASWLDDGPWTEAFDRVASVMRVQARLAVSTDVEAPAALGVRAPMVLLPVHVLEYLPHESLAPVLAHELAHVARRDYAAHLAQSVVEAALFHSPAIWWIGRRLREAREFCCDDAAVAVAGTRTAYVEALTLVARLGAGVTRPAIGMAGPRLVTRVRRLLEGEPIMSLSLVRVVAVTVLTVAITAALPLTFTSASRHVSAQLRAASQEGAAVPHAYPQRQDGSALRIVRVESTDTHVCGRFRLQNLGSVAVAQVRVVGVLSFRPGANRPVQIVESDWLTQRIPAGATVTLDVPLVDVADARRVAGGGHVQAHCAVRELVYENRVAWHVTPNAATTTGEEALGFRRWPTLARALVGQTRAAAYPRLTLCLDEQSREYSPGAQVEIRDEPGSAARCTTAGQWVAVDRGTGEPLEVADREVTLDVRVDGMPPLAVTSAVGAVATVQVAGGRTWGFVPSLAADGVEVAVHDLSTTPHRLIGTRTLQSGGMTRVQDGAGAIDIGLAAQ